MGSRKVEVSPRYKSTAIFFFNSTGIKPESVGPDLMLFPFKRSCCLSLFDSSVSHYKHATYINSRSKENTYIYGSNTCFRFSGWNKVELEKYTHKNWRYNTMFDGRWTFTINADKDGCFLFCSNSLKFCMKISVSRDLNFKNNL